MANGELKISKETFQNMKPVDRDWEVFQTMCCIKKEHGERLTKLERRKHLDTTISGMTGLLGGGLAVLLKGIFIKGHT